MPKTIRLSLDESSINSAITELKVYKSNLTKKTTQLVQMMLNEGETYCVNAVGHIDTGETVNSIKAYRSGNKGMISVGGNAIWIEFGTGVSRNTTEHPNRAELGMFRWGEYGKGNGAKPGWWYQGDDGQFHYTKGIKATMFMWKTAIYMRLKCPTWAREVFKND